MQPLTLLLNEVLRLPLAWLITFLWPALTAKPKMEVEEFAIRVILFTSTSTTAPYTVCASLSILQHDFTIRQFSEFRRILDVAYISGRGFISTILSEIAANLCRLLSLNMSIFFNKVRHFFYIQSAQRFLCVIFAR